MEPQSPTPVPTPEPETTPTPEPTLESPSVSETTPLPTPTPSPADSQAPVAAPLSQPEPTPPVGSPAPQPPKNKSRALILGIVAGAIVLIALIIGVISFALMNNKKDTANDNSNKTDSSKVDTKKDTEELRDANAVTADSMSDLSAVCENGSIKNAAAFAKPYKFAVFNNNTGRGSWSNTTLSYDNESAVKYNDFAQANVIACLTRDDSTAVKSMTCDFKTGGETVTADFYAVKYKTTLYEAQSGKKIKDLAVVNGPATKCPSFTTFNKNDPKIYADADKVELEANLATFAQE